MFWLTKPPHPTLLVSPNCHLSLQVVTDLFSVVSQTILGSHWVDQENIAEYIVVETMRCAAVIRW